MKTGFLDDPRIELPPDHQLYNLALFAWERQRAGWSITEHGALWRGLLPLWPRAGRRPYKDGLSRVVEYLQNVLQLDRDEIADVIGVSGADAVRRVGYERRGHDLECDSPFDRGLDHEVKALPGPVVYPTSDPAPAHVFAALDGSFAPEPHPIVEQAWKAANEKERAMWKSGELVRMGGLAVRRLADGDADFNRSYAAMRRLLEQQGNSSEEVDEIIRDGQERGKLPLPGSGSP